MSILGVIACLLAGFSVTLTKKFKNNFELAFKIAGDDLMRFIVIATSGLVASTGVSGVRSSCNESEPVSQ
jgi:hypothetical protein